MSIDYSSSVEHVKLSELNRNIVRLPNTRKEIINGATLIRITGWLQIDARLNDQNMVLLFSREPIRHESPNQSRIGEDQESNRESSDCVFKVLVDISLIKNALNLSDLNLKHDLVQLVGYRVADSQRSLPDLIAHGTTIAENMNIWPIGLSCNQEDVELYPRFKAIYHRFLKRANLNTYYQAIDIQRNYLSKSSE